MSLVILFNFYASNHASYANCDHGYKPCRITISGLLFFMYTILKIGDVYFYQLLVLTFILLKRITKIKFTIFLMKLCNTGLFLQNYFFSKYTCQWRYIFLILVSNYLHFAISSELFIKKFH